MKYLKFYLLLFILFLTPNVFATSINADSYSQKDVFNTARRYDYSTNQYIGDDTNYSIGSIGTRYNGKSYYFQFNFHHTLTANKVYELKVSSTTNDFTSYISKDYITPLCYSSFAYNFNTKECADISVISVIRSSGTQSKDFTIRFVPTQAIVYWGFKFQAGFNNLTGVNNFLINDFDLIEVSADNTDEIINNQTQNTQDIIDNQSQNTQDIIKSQQDLLGSCITNHITGYTNLLNMTYSNSIFTQITGDTSSNFEMVLQAFNNSTYVRGLSQGTPSGLGYFYLSFVKDNTFNTLQFKENGSTRDTGVRFNVSDLEDGKTYYVGANFLNINPTNGFSFSNLMVVETPIDFFIPWGQTKCSSKLDDTNNIMSDTNAYLKDNSNPNISDNEFLSVFNNIGFTDPLQHLLQLPVQFINALVSQSNTCQTINLGTLWGVALTLPCINLENIIGSNVWGIIDILMSIGLLVVIVKNLYQTFANLMTMGGEKEAREKFSMPTPMEFLSMILGGDK